MTLRDQFASHAIAAFLMRVEDVEYSVFRALNLGQLELAEWAYVVADAMVYARKAKKAQCGAKDMALRDGLASHALLGLLSRKNCFNFEMFRQDPKRAALWSYDVADVALLVRSKSAASTKERTNRAVHK